MRKVGVAIWLAGLVTIAVSVILVDGYQKGECIVCTGAEPAAATAAKTAGEVAAATGAAGGAAGGTGLTIGAGGITGLTAGAAGAAGLSPALAAAGFTAGQAAGAGLAAGVGASLASGAGGGGSAAAWSPTLTQVATGASIANAGMGLLTGMKGTKTPDTPRAPSLLAPIVMPAADDEAQRRARAAMTAKLQQRRGRASTILSNDTLGGS